MPSGLSGQNLKIKNIFKHYKDISASLRLYFSPANPDYATTFASEPEAHFMLFGGPLTVNLPVRFRPGKGPPPASRRFGPNPGTTSWL